MQNVTGSPANILIAKDNHEFEFRIIVNLHVVCVLVTFNITSSKSIFPAKTVSCLPSCAPDAKLCTLASGMEWNGLQTKRRLDWDTCFPSVLPHH